MSKPETTTVPRPGPVTTTLTESYWKRATDGELWFQRCGGCGHCQHYPSGMCRTCWSRDLEWVLATGEGVVWSFTVVGKPGHPAWIQDTPYVLALVELEEGPRLMTNIVECDPYTVHVGQRVHLAPARDPAQPPLQFRPAPAGSEIHDGRTTP